MPSRKYSLQKNEPQRLEISWSGVWKDIKILLDGQEIGQIDGLKELKTGQDFKIKEGTLHVQFVMGFMNGELQVTLDGKPLPGSGSDPAERLKIAYITIFFIAGLNLALGIAAEFLQIDFLQEIGVGIFSAGFGLVFLILGYLVMKKQSIIALWIAIALFIVDGVLTMFVTIDGGYDPAMGSILMRIILIVGMIQGLKGAKDLKKESAQNS